MKVDICVTNGINLDNMNITEVVLRDGDFNDIDQIMML